MNNKTDGGEPVDFLRRLAEAGIVDTLILNQETAESVITGKRMELIEEIATGDVESVRDLARRVGRDVSIVSRDLDILFEAGIIEFEQSGRAKRPVITHENILVEPIVFGGEVVPRGDNSEKEVLA